MAEPRREIDPTTGPGCAARSPVPRRQAPACLCGHGAPGLPSRAVVLLGDALWSRYTRGPAGVGLLVSRVRCFRRSRHAGRWVLRYVARPGYDFACCLVSTINNLEMPGVIAGHFCFVGASISVECAAADRRRVVRAGSSGGPLQAKRAAARRSRLAHEPGGSSVACVNSC